MAVPDFSSYLVSNGDTTSATKFDNFVNAAQASLNAIGDATKTTWAPGQILAPSQISQGGASTHQGLVWNGSAWAASSLAAIDTKTLAGASINYTNSTTETDLFTGTTGSAYLVLGAGTLTASGGISIRMGGTYTNNSGAVRTLRLKIRTGASAGAPAFTTFTSIWDSGVSDNIAASANARAWDLQIQLQALGATNSQTCSGLFTLSSATAATTGTGPLTQPNNAAILAPFQSAAGTVDYTAATGIVVSAIHSTASASLTMSTSYYRIEVAS